MGIPRILGFACTALVLACSSSSSNSLPAPSRSAEGGASNGIGGQSGSAGGPEQPAAGAPAQAGFASGGAAGTASAAIGGGASSGAAGAAGTDAFTLVFRDDFDALDTGRWQLMTHSWDGNLALFSTSAVEVGGGELRISLTPAPAGTVDTGGVAKSFLGAEVRSTQTVSYGRVRARMRFASGSAVVSSLVTIYTPWPADDWNELDIEHLGKDAGQTQFNAQVYTGPPVTPPVTASVAPTQDPKLVDLGFDPAADFHVYTIEWTPAGARFVVDDVLRHSWTTHIELMGLPQNVLMTIWASSSATWAGAVTDATGQGVAVYDWLELYQLSP